MVEAEQLQHRGMKVIHVDLVLDRAKPKFICCADCLTTFDAATCKPCGEAVWVDFTGYVLDYGAYPDQQCAYFTLRDARLTLPALRWNFNAPMATASTSFNKLRSCCRRSLSRNISVPSIGVSRVSDRRTTELPIAVTRGGMAGPTLTTLVAYMKGC